MEWKDERIYSLYFYYFNLYFFNKTRILIIIYSKKSKKSTKFNWWCGYFTSLNAKYIAKRLNITDDNKYDRANIIFPFSNKLIISREKVENVVNPPQNPVFRKLILNSLMLDFKLAATIRPIKNEPKIFIIIVIILLSYIFIGIKPKRYLDIEPKAPPKETAIIFN